MWITPTSITERLGGPEYDGVTKAALKMGQTGEQLVANELARTLTFVRGYVGRRNVLGPDNTIPDELESATLALLVFNILTRIPGLKLLLTDERKEAQKDALKLLRDVAAGDFVIVPPLVRAPTPEQPEVRGMISVSRKQPRVFSREQLKRLF